MNKIPASTGMAFAVMLAGCATTPAPLQGTYSSTRPTVGSTAAAGETVRWGGTIVETSPGPEQTCFQVLSRNLSSTGRPARVSADVNDARFVACRAGFYDPAVFSQGREVTFIGQTTAPQPVKIGNFDYRVPALSASVVYLWPQRPDVVRVRPSPFYDPFWGPRWGRYGWWGWW